MKHKENNRHYHHHYGGELGTNGGMFNKEFDLRFPKKDVPFLRDGELRFGGTLESLEKQFKALTPEEVQSVKRMQISISGEMIQEPRQTCQKMTVFFSLFGCFLPLLLFKCDCYNKKVQAIYEQGLQYYERIAAVIGNCKNLNHLTMYIQDNYLNSLKTSTLEKTALSNSNLTYWWLTNCVLGMDLNDKEYTRFDELMAQSRVTDRLLFNIHWDDKHFKKLPNEINQTYENLTTVAAIPK